MKAKTEIATKNLSGRLSSIAGLSSGIPDYDGKKMLTEEAVIGEKDAAEMLRTLARITVTARAAGDDLTVERRANQLVRLQQNLFTAWSLLSCVESKLSGHGIC